MIKAGALIEGVIRHISPEVAAFRKIDPLFSSKRDNYLLVRKAAACILVPIPTLLRLTSHTFPLFGFISVF